MNGKRPRSRTVARPEMWTSYLGGILSETAFVVALMLLALGIAALVEATL